VFTFIRLYAKCQVRSCPQHPLLLLLIPSSVFAVRGAAAKAHRSVTFVILSSVSRCRFDLAISQHQQQQPSHHQSVQLLRYTYNYAIVVLPTGLSHAVRTEYTGIIQLIRHDVIVVANDDRSVAAAAERIQAGIWSSCGRRQFVPFVNAAVTPFNNSDIPITITKTKMIDLRFTRTWTKIFRLKEGDNWI